MNEEIKEDNNCIVKAFENNPIAILQEDINNKKVYCFKASDIGKALKLTNIAVSIQYYDDDERVIRKAYDTTKRLQDTTFLTSQGVYRLLYNSKKEIAKKFRKWAGNILDDIIFNESVELKKKLEEKERQHQIELQEKENLLQESSKELSRTKKQLELKTKLQVKKWYDSEPGHTIYAVKSNTNDANSLITIGKSKNIAQRESNYFTHNQESDMFFVRKCFNCDLAEKVLHHMLDKYRLENNKEWFQISEELATYVINLVCNFLDNFINNIDELPKTTIMDDIIKISNSFKLQDDKIDIKIQSNVPEISFKEFDYDKFINECCELDQNYYCIPEEILGAYKLWSRINIDTSRKNLLYNHLKNKFNMEKKYIELYKSKIQIFIGVKPKRIHFNIDNKLLTQFLQDKCDIGYTYKITEKQFLESYTEYIKKGLTNDELIELKAILNNVFYFGNINYSKEKKKYGYVGFKLKIHKETIHCLRNKHTKKINKININTKQIEDTFQSINEASHMLKIDYRTAQTYLKHKKIFNEYYILEYCE
jgi:prophage antirepressor-like protein